MNKRIALSAFVILGAAACLSACAPMKPRLGATACSDGSPKKDVTISYGDSKLEVDVKEKKVKRDDYLVFKLKPDSTKGPDGLDYKTVTVTVSGKNSASQWISASGSDVGSGGEFIVCVPTGQAYDTYEYLVQVNEVGTLDPRVIVEP